VIRNQLGEIKYMDGLIIISKPKEWTSHDIVNKVKKITGEKVGHTGTLDPNATGVLPLLIGKGTQASKYLINHDKIYEVVLKLGIKTDTADSEGKVLQEQYINDSLIQEKNISNVLYSFVGKGQQTPPIYSAIKVNGKKLYEYARKGQEVKIEPRNIEIYDIKLNGMDIKAKEINFTVSCSKGTYIRSLCEDIAVRLGTIGFMKELNRIQVGEFNINQAVTIEELQENINNVDFLNKHFISLEKLFERNSQLKLDDKKLKFFFNGVCLTFKLPDGLYRIYDNASRFIGTGTVKGGLLKRDIII